MTERMIPRREVLAFIALNTDEASAPSMVEFREYGYEGREWHVIDLTVGTEAAVRFWAGVFGHGERAVHHNVHTRKDGSRWTSHYSQATGWRGFTTEIRANVDEHTEPEPLDDATREQLAAIADEPQDGTR
jgi:hypothetical protein